jgi:cell surface protein SprA
MSSVLLAAVWAAPAGAVGRRYPAAWSTWVSRLGLPQGLPGQTVPGDTGRYQPSRRPRLRTVRDRPGSRFGQRSRRSPLVLPLPKNVQLQVTPDDSLKNYNVRETVGSQIDYRDPISISQEQLLKFQERQAINDYYRQKAMGGVAGAPAAPGSPQAQRLIPKIYLGPIADRIFGGSYIDIRPAGSLTLKAGAKFNVNRNPALTLRQQSVGDFLFEQNMNLSLSGQVGTKLKLTFNYDTKAAFDFDNQMKFDYAGQPTDILRKLDLGNVSMPLNNSLITGGSNLFGIKTQLQFGRLGVTAVAATLRGAQDEVRVQNGAQSRTFELKASQYERDRHYFLSQYFRDNYDRALQGLPTVKSGFEIRRLEVWVTNDNRTTDNLRNVVALQDLAEPRLARIYRPDLWITTPDSGRYATPKNSANYLYPTISGPGSTRENLQVESFLNNLNTPKGSVPLVKGLDFERLRARKLQANEYTFNAQLGYVNLNTALLPDQVLAVSYEYLYNGKSYTVGETQTEYAGAQPDQVIFLKMLKATNPGVGTANPATNPANRNLLTRNTPTWDLMMKNIYPLNTSQLNRDNFQLQIIYKDDVTGVDLISLKEGVRIQNIPLIEVFGLDRVNANNDRNADGNFDYFPGITIDPELGKIIFPSVQPFGSYLKAQFDTLNANPAIATAERQRARTYVFQALYNQTQSDAQQQQTKDKFFLRGRYQGTSTNDISLPGIGVAQGSVRVYAGSTLLTEGVDYQVYYDQAKVTILNPAYLNSANELRVTFEKNALVQVQPRKLLGTRLDYALSPDVVIGGTAMHILENQAPGINRVNIGDEPANNTILGADISLRKDSRVLTKLVDRLPFLATKETSTVAFTGEVAKLIAGQSKLGNGENGASYLDDFENARTPYTLGGLAAVPAWRLAATPSPVVGSTIDGLANGYRRAKLAWYTVDQSYYTNGPNVPAGITAATLANHYTRGVQRNEVFPNKDLGATGNGYEYTFDMAYFPNERGPYNYTPTLDPTDPTGRRFTPPAAQNLGLNRSRFGGISRGITFDTDFDNANVEYLEFWLMDPFLTGSRALIDDSQNPATSNNTGGRLVLNLGNISEDVLRDQGQHEFENGLPVPGQDTTGLRLTRSTVYGRVTNQQFLLDAFNATPGARASQDVGLDGLTNTDEQVFFSSRVPGYGALPDPSNDDFRHHLDPSYDAANVQILGRYKDYDNYEGNSPENSQLSSSAYPDKEDLNRDNVIQNTEQYYEYPIDLQPGRLTVGQNYVTDKVTNTINGDQVSWYQFRIPIRQPQRVEGNNGQPFGFKNIRFMRLYLTGWEQPVVLRMVQPQFVANQWRQYLSRIVDPAIQVPGIGTATDADAFAISTVSVEENGPSAASATAPGATPTGAIPYVVPPNITRDVEYGSTAVSRRQNEQSLRLAVTNLRDGYAKAAYKNLATNLLRYKRLRMYFHGESSSSTIKDGDVRAFIRIGTDYSQNYYEYALPLVITRPGATAQLEVWPEANNLDLALQDFIDAKAERNQQGTVQYTVPYVKTLANGATITIVGNPDLSQVQGCMIGVLNPAATNTGTDTDASDKSVTLWADEMRVFDFDNQGGWAANARLSVKLADLANITATGSFIGVGFGGLQDKAQQRSTSDIVRGDLNATVAAEKFLPSQLRVKVPVLVQVGRQTITPQYDPLDPDTKLEQSLQKFRNNPDPSAAATYKNLVVDRTTTRSISVLNVRKERAPSQTTTHPWDVENLAVSYAITERLHTDINTQRDYTQAYTAALAYVYQTQPRNYTPLASFKALDNPYLKIFQQVNFTPLPSRFSFRTDLDRRYNERFLQRVTEPGQLPTVASAGVFYKSFYINRIYDLKWDITKALIIDYTANNRGVIDEGAGQSLGDSQTALDNRAQQWENLKRGGRTTNFNQTVALTYRLPLDKFPLTDWISADTRYSAHYSWQAASTALGIRTLANPTNLNDTTTVLANLGNTVQNNRELSANGKIDLVKLYNKVKFLNIINNAQPANPPRPALTDPNNPTAPTRPQPTAPDTAKKDPLRFVKAVLRAVMTARSINFTYSQSAGTLLPGYLPNTNFLGLQRGSLAPGVPFILGQQYEAIGDTTSARNMYSLARRNGWYTKQSQYLNTPISNILTENLTARTTLEPFRGFNIQLDLRRQKVRNNEAYYRRAIDTASVAYLTSGTLNSFADGRMAAVLALGTGSYSVSTITVQTLFGDLGANGETSKAFNRFVANRAIVQQRLQAANPSAVRDVITTPATATTPAVYTRQATNLYSYNSQDVLLQSFLDAYHGKSSDGYEAESFNPFSVIPLPNWNIQYNGFSDLPGVRDVFRSVSLNHVYSSVYNLGSYTTSSRYSQEPSFGPSAATPFVSNATGQYVPYYVVGQVSLIESMAPLLGLRFQTVNNVTGNVQYNTARAVALNITNAQVTELHTTELVIGLGYAAAGFKLPFRVGGEQRVLKNNLSARMDLSIRDNSTIQRSILGSVDPVPATTGSPTANPVVLPSAAVAGVVGTPISQITTGALQVQLRPTIDYLLNARLNLQFYFSQTITQPRVSNAFRNATTEGGIQLRYSLQ